MLDTSLLRTNRDGKPLIDVKITDDIVVHCFDITEGDVTYWITTRQGELIANASANVTDMQDVNGHLTSMTLATSALVFEVVRGPDYDYKAYKSLRH